MQSSDLLDIGPDHPSDAATTDASSPPPSPPPASPVFVEIGTVGTTALSSTSAWQALLVYGKWDRLIMLACSDASTPIVVTLQPLGETSCNTDGLVVPSAVRIARAVFGTQEPTAAQLRACSDARVLEGRRVVVVFGSADLWKGRRMITGAEVVPADTGVDPAVMAGLLERMAVDMAWLKQRAVVVGTAAASVLGVLAYGLYRAKAKRQRGALTEGKDDSGPLIS